MNVAVERKRRRARAVPYNHSRKKTLRIAQPQGHCHPKGRNGKNATYVDNTTPCIVTLSECGIEPSRLCTMKQPARVELL